MDAQRLADAGSARRGALARWWNQSDDFDWLSGYLQARGLDGATKVLMAVVSGALIFTAVATLTAPTVPVAIRVVFSILAVGVGVTYCVRWLRGWPTRLQSLGMVWLGAAILALGCVLQPHPMLALIGCTGMVIITGYAAFFHNTKAIAVGFTLAVVAGIVCAVRVFNVDGWIPAIAGLWLVIELNLAVPLAIQAVVRTLGADVLRSDQDPLTGVLTRRAFYEQATTLLTSPGDDLHLVVVMIDLDKFKQLNDTYGHLAGDQVLTAVGWTLRETATSSAIIGRFGGEEFIVIAAASADRAEHLPARLCSAIAALPQPVTASVGAAIVRWAGDSAIDDLIHAADAAMYTAKRAGGNQTEINWVAGIGT